MVEVSMLSVRRVLLDSNSSRQTCFGSFALTFMCLDPLSEVFQDLLRDCIRRAVLPQPVGQDATVRQRLPRTLPGHLGHDVGGLVLQPLLGLRPRLAHRLPVLAVRPRPPPQPLDSLPPGTRPGPDWLL